MPKGGTDEGRGKNTISVIREQLHALEVGAATLERMAPEEVLDLLKRRDQMENELVRLEMLGVDLRGERAQIQATDGRLYQKTGRVARALRKFGGFAAMREELKPSEDRWWWYLDIYRRRRIARDLRKVLIVTAAVICIAILGNFVADKLWGMDPEQKVAYGHKSDGDQHVVQGEYDAAIAAYEAAAQAYDGDPEVYASLAVLYEIQGRPEESSAALERADALVPDQSEYLTLVGQAYVGVGRLDKTLEYTSAAIEADPDYVFAYYVRSTAYEIKGETSAAIADLNKVTELADEQGFDELYVLAKQRIGVMLQGGAAGF